MTESHWVRRPRFDPHAFARSSDTIYSLSKEGTFSGQSGNESLSRTRTVDRYRCRSH